MGYRRKPQVYKLRFEDEEYEGLVVRVRSLPLGQFLEITRLADEAEANPQQVEALLTAFASALVDWNLEEDGPDGEVWSVPADKNGLYRQDLDFVFMLIREWMQAIAGVPAPLGEGSTSGPTSEELSLPMEPLSGSLPN